MQIRTSELIGKALDWAVATCEDFKCGEFEIFIKDDMLVARSSRIPWAYYNPSTDWSQGGLIIEREWLDVAPWPNESDPELRWQCKQHDSIDTTTFGPTPLVAAMRCYVASKLGEVVEVPDELVKE